MPYGMFDDEREEVVDVGGAHGGQEVHGAWGGIVNMNRFADYKTARTMSLPLLDEALAALAAAGQAPQAPGMSPPSLENQGNAPGDGDE